jgi:hypothetical protein
MIKVSSTLRGKTVFIDDANLCPPVELSLVKAALAAGLTDFTIPTVEDDEKRIDYSTRTWITMRDEKPAAFVVAFRTANAHFEILGPEIQLSQQSSPPQLQKR